MQASQEVSHPGSLARVDVVGGALKPGDLIANTFRVDRLLSMGGMGALYAGHHDVTGDLVAIKVILPRFANDERTVRLFQREAQTLKRLNHPAIVGYEAFLRDASGGLLLIMEFVAGRSLAERMGIARLSVDETIRLGDRLVAGLAVAHERGVVHRDLSPANVMLPDGVVDEAKLIDFGIAKRLKGDESSIIGDSFAGKVRYAAPEQLGLFGGAVDARSDIYTLGLVLAEAIGLRVRGGDGIAEAIAVRGKDAELPDNLDPRLRGRLTSMLRADPATRPETIATAWSLDGLSSEAPPAPSGRRPRVLSLILAALVLLIVGLGTWAWFGYAPTSVPALLTTREILELPTDEARARAQTLLATGGEDNLDMAFRVLAQLGRTGDGKAAFLVAEMYDPATYSSDTSPFSRSNAEQAGRWYQRAAEAGLAEARERLQELRP